MKIADRKGLRTWLEIDKKTIESNVKAFRKLISKDTKFCAVVKSNAYGHGLVDFSRELSKIGVDMFAVDSMVEARRLRKESISTPIFVLGYTLPELFSESVSLDVAISISSMDSLKLVVREKKSIRVHIKVDTGMSRQGFLPDEKDKLISFLKKNKNKIIVDGLFTHFASAKNPAFPAETKKQIEEFKKWKEAFLKAGFNPICHASATAGTILFPEAHFDMVRIGIGLYGLWPSNECEAYANHSGLINLIPVLTWKTIVSEVKKVSKGSGVGYDFTEHLKKDSTLAICPVGYWHGFPRALSSIGYVKIKGKDARVVGRVSMDMIVVDISNIGAVKTGDEVTLLGQDITAKEISVLADTTWYEIVTRINPLIKKFYI